MTTPARLPRLCDVCGQLDDHPRHVTAVPIGYDGAVPDDAFLDRLPDGAPARAIAELMDPSTLVRHLDCCAAAGCESCQQAEQVNGGLRGAKLVAKIEGGSINHLSGSGPDIAAASAPEES